MAYSILDPVTEGERREAGRERLCALAVMAKAPRAGRVKTRLSPPLSSEQAAELNICFLQDTTRNIAEVVAEGRAAGLISYTPVGDEGLFEGLLPEGFALIAQRGDGFGERLLYAAENILACGYGAVCLIDSDSPTLPTGSLRAAVEALRAEGDRVVVGGSEDGGYYLIGMKLAHREPFERITWSTESVYAETVERVRAMGVELVELEKWYDVDDATSLRMLRRELLLGAPPDFAAGRGYEAALTREYLRALGEPGQSGKLG